MTCVFLLIIFFFFQAEDGIRDLTVTGVQTCALPISHVCERRPESNAIIGREYTDARPLALVLAPVTDVTIVLLNWNSRPLVFEAAASAVRQTGVTAELIIVDNGSTDGSLEELKSRFPEARYLEIRSEERRVGKEGR